MFFFKFFILFLQTFLNILVKENDEEGEDEDAPELDSSKLNADGDVKLTGLLM